MTWTEETAARMVESAYDHTTMPREKAEFLATMRQMRRVQRYRTARSWVMTWLAGMFALLFIGALLRIAGI